MNDKEKEELLRKVFGTPRSEPKDPADLSEKEIEMLSDLLAENDELLKKIVERWEKSRVIDLNSVLPQNAVMSRAKLRSVINKDILDIGTFEVTVSKKTAKKEVTITADIRDMSDNKSKNYTAYDLSVMDAVNTLWAVGNAVMTPEMIYRAMNGYTDQEDVSPQAVSAVTKSLDKMRMTYARIDFTKEAEMRNVKADSYILEGNMVMADKVTASVGGYKKNAYKFYRLPLLHEYSRLNNYLLSVPVEIMNTKTALRTTPEVIVIRSYLIRRIEAMKSDKNGFNGYKVLYDSIFEDCNITVNNKQTRNKYMGHIKKLLNYWKDQGYIIGYEEYKKGRTIAGINLRVK